MVFRRSRVRSSSPAHLFVKIGHEVISTAILSLPLNQVGQDVHLVLVNRLSPYLTGMRLLATVLRFNSRTSLKTVVNRSQGFAIFSQESRTGRGRFAKILNMSKICMRQNSSQNNRKVIACVSNPSRTIRIPIAI